MRRRDFTTGLLLAATTQPARAQERTKQHRIAIIISAAPVASISYTGNRIWQAFFAELAAWAMSRDKTSAATAGIEPGDVIVQVDQKPVKTPQQAAEELRQAAAKGNILLLLNRQGKSQFVGLSVGGAG